MASPKPDPSLLREASPCTNLSVKSPGLDISWAEIFLKTTMTC